MEWILVLYMASVHSVKSGGPVMHPFPTEQACRQAGEAISKAADNTPGYPKGLWAWHVCVPTEPPSSK